MVHHPPFFLNMQKFDALILFSSDCNGVSKPSGIFNVLDVLSFKSCRDADAHCSSARYMCVAIRDIRLLCHFTNGPSEICSTLILSLPAAYQILEHPLQIQLLEARQLPPPGKRVSGNFSANFCCTHFVF
jgi:hypothetical protein